MARTKKRVAEQSTDEPTVAPESSGVVAPADDRTAIDEIESRKKSQEKESLPDGFKKQLPGGESRKIRVVYKELDNRDGKPIRVTESDGTETDYDEVLIQGPSRLRRTSEVVDCVSRGSCHIETEAPILVGSGRKVRKKKTA